MNQTDNPKQKQQDYRVEDTEGGVDGDVDGRSDLPACLGERPRELKHTGEDLPKPQSLSYAHPCEQEVP